MRDERIDELQFTAIGPVPAAVLRDVVVRVSRALGVPCRIVPAGGDVHAETMDGRAQVDADRLLAEVEARATTPGAVLVALAAADMGNPIFTHFFGRARLGGRAAVVSLARLSPAFYGLAADADVSARRAAVEVLHEFGHVAGLGHCSDVACLMRLAHHVEAIDVRGTEFCDACAARLPRELRARRTSSGPGRT